MKEKTRILMVEDDTPLAMMMVCALTRVGCDVDAVHTGKKGLELARERRFDLITLDIKLPDADGFSICSELKLRHISRNTPVVFISGSPNPDDITEGKKRGAVDYITKPFSLEFVPRLLSHIKQTGTIA